MSPSKRRLSLVVHNIRSTHNVGSILRSADGFGIEKVYLTGYTPYPREEKDERLPHLATKIDRQITKTALGAEKTVAWEKIADIQKVIKNLRGEGYKIIALEQSPTSVSLVDYKPSSRSVLILGAEVDGLPLKILELADEILEIPMKGAKESFNVAVAAAVAMYHLTVSG